MSVSRGCYVIEAEPNKWWCVVANDEYDYDFNSGEKFGPARTADEAYQKMRDSTSNPGGHSIFPFPVVTDCLRDLLARIPAYGSWATASRDRIFTRILRKKAPSFS